MFGFKKKVKVTSYPEGREGHPVSRLLRGNRGAARMPTLRNPRNRL